RAGAGSPGRQPGGGAGGGARRQWSRVGRVGLVGRVGQGGQVGRVGQAHSMRVTIVFAFVLATATLSAQDWPMFRGPRASGVGDGSPAPVRWNVKTGDNILWTT